MNILITGATGFVGEYLVNYFRDKNHNVFKGVRNGSANNERAYGNLEDFHQKKDWSEFFKDIEVVVHCAARVHVMNETSENPLLEFRRLNVEATKVLAENSVLAGVKKFIFLSTIKVNGEETFKKPFTEYDEPKPVDAYGISKLEAEEALKEMSSVSGLRVAVVRSPLIYGPGVKGNVLRLQKLVKQWPLIPLGGISNKRSMLSLLNLSKLIECIIFNGGEKPYDVFLGSDGYDVSTSILMSAVAKSQNKRVFLIPIPVKLMKFILKILGKKSLSQRLFGDLQVSSLKAMNEVMYKPSADINGNFIN